MQQMKSLEVDSSTFIRFLLDTVERFDGKRESAPVLFQGWST